jgi:DNA segregation ATPase FtsK/SpoIIIE, S-DNA-T family
VAADGIVDVDLVRDGPHGLLAGTTGAGKSELLRSLVMGLATTTSPEQLTFVLIDYKGGATFDSVAELPHVVGIVTDLDEHLADRALRSLRAELRWREQLLRHHGASDLDALRSRAPTVVMVVVDEFAALVAEQPTFLSSLVGVAQRGRSLGVHLILATQRPAGVISDDIRANTNLRIALRLHDAADAQDVLGDSGPSMIGRGQAGRAMMRLGPDEIITFQTASCTVGDDHDRLLSAIQVAAQRCEIAAPRRPWLPDLPARLVADAAWPVDQVGVVDDPDLQAQPALRVEGAAGHLLISGAPGMGATSALITLANADTSGAEQYLIDASSGVSPQRTAGDITVVRLGERELLSKLLHRLDQRTRQVGANGPPLLLIDGLDLLRADLDDPASFADLDLLDRLLVVPPTVLRVVATCRRAAGLSAAVQAAFPQRWMLHTTDMDEAAALGATRSALNLPAAPGRLLDVRSGLHAQLVAPDARPPRRQPALSAAPLRCVPTQVHPCDLPKATWLDETLHAPIGLSFVADEPMMLQIPDGEHVVVLGPARSGKTLALRRLAEAWREQHGTGRIVVVQPRQQNRPAARALAAIADHTVVDIADLETAANGRGLRSPDGAPRDDESRTLLIVDDAELTDDPRGFVAALIKHHGPRLTVVAAAKADALRQSYGHWTSVLRRSRLGIVSALGGELDGDLLGVLLPQRLPTAARPGLSWVVDNGEFTLCQIACDGRIAESASLPTQNLTKCQT